MNFSVFGIILIALKLTSAFSDRVFRRDVPAEENLRDNWYNMDQELDGSHPDQGIAPAHFSINLHMEFPQPSREGEKMTPIVKNPMWIDKLAIIKAPPMMPTMLEDPVDDIIPINYRSRSMDRDAYQMMKIRRRRSTQQNTKKSTRQSDKKSKFKAWLESKMDKKLGEKISERFSKLKKPALNRQTRSVEQNHITESKEEEENRINRASNCSNCGGLNQACPFCHSPFLIGPIYPPRPQFIEIVNGEPRTYIPGSHPSSIVGASPRYIYDQLGHKYLERDGMLQILPPPIVDSPIVAIPPNYDYMQMLSETIQRYPHFHTSHRLEDGYLTDDLIQQTKDVLDLIKGLTKSQNYDKNHQKRHTHKYNANKDGVTETIVEEDELHALLMEDEQDFEKYLKQIGYNGDIGTFEMPNMETNDQNPVSQSIFYDTSMSASQLTVPSAKKPQHHTSGTTLKQGSQVYKHH
ncbi:uncharacterized protein LOC129802768 [Phlebotomus papatasi]|uniref:uncharacterized protein LOC129802768 n=1 Tax=Phlebotomus papatasi TaxID=29031 RepID=UPI0024833428|nr:uncharacterized protein LOC129802768 [Phlebotomus papatasi]